MFGKTMRMGVLMTTAVGAPFLWYNEPLATKVRSKVQSLTGGSSGWSWPGGGTQDISLTSHLDPQPLVGAAGATDGVWPTLTGPADSDLQNVLRFDISPRWVTERWSRVSTVRAEPGWEGLRVPLVTGTRVDDLAGSLTYYFDPQHQVRRITFHGVTGDERKLVGFVSHVYDVQPDADLSGSVHVARWNGQPTSVLRVALAPVIRADMPHSRLEILLELNRPGVGFRLSSQSELILRQHRENRGW